MLPLAEASSPRRALASLVLADARFFRVSRLPIPLSHILKKCLVAANAVDETFPAAIYVVPARRQGMLLCPIRPHTKPQTPPTLQIHILVARVATAFFAALAV